MDLSRAHAGGSFFAYKYPVFCGTVRVPSTSTVRRTQDTGFLVSTMQPTTFIYALADPLTGNVRYVGKSDNPARRLGRHLNDRRDCHRVRWLRLLVRAGLRPCLLILETVPQTDWQAAECRWIENFKAAGFDLVNSTDGGQGPLNMAQETRDKISKANKGRVPSEVTRRKMSLVFTGRPKSVETRRKMSEALRKRMSTPEARKKVGDQHRGVVPSAEARRKMSESRKGKPLSEEARRKIAAANTGKVKTEETKRKIAAARMGHIVTDETRLKISETLKALAKAKADAE